MDARGLRAVCLAAVKDSEDRHHARLVIDDIEDPVVAHTDSPSSEVRIAEQGAARWSWVMLQRVNMLLNAVCNFWGESPEIPPSGGANDEAHQ